MDFDKGLNSLHASLKNNGKEWYKNLADLRDEALKPDSISVSGESPIDPRYQAAVNWYNIRREAHLTDKQCSKFVFFIASGWGKNGSYGENEILGWKHLRALGIESEFQKELIGRGAEISPDALKEKVGEYLITFIPGNNLAVKKKPSGDSFDRMDLDPINTLDSRKIIRGFLDNPSPLVWCSSLKNIENSIQRANTFDEIAQRLGMSHAPTGIDSPTKFYGIKISTDSLFGDLKFPTVADARLFHVFEPSRDKVGFTLDLRDGKPDLPEVVIRRDILSNAYKTDKDILEVVLCKAKGAEKNRHTWVLTRPVGCEIEHQKNRLERVRREVRPSRPGVK